MPGTARLATASPATVRAVTVAVSSTAAPLPPGIARRVEHSVTTVAQEILVGRGVDEVAANHATYEQVIRDVFDRLLMGYSVQQVSIIAGATTAVQVRLLPWGDTVQSVTLQLHTAGLAPPVQELVARDLTGLNGLLQDTLVGMPVDAMTWAGDVASRLIRSHLAARLPEFIASIDVQPGANTVVSLSLLPQGETVQDVRVSLHSRTIPNLLLLSAQSQLAEQAKMLRGLPVSFVTRHQDFFLAALQQTVADDATVRRYKLTVTPTLRPGQQTTADVQVDTAAFRIFLEGYFYVGRQNSDTSAKLHLGKPVDRHNEFFLETTFVPSSFTWTFEPGWGYRLGQDTETGLRYNLDDHYTIAYLYQDISPRWHLRLEHSTQAGKSEVGLAYRLHDFLSAEYVVTDNDHWLRLIGNL